MYRTFRILRIVISLLAMAVPTWALIAGYQSVFVRMQILTALISGAAVCLIFWAAVTLVYGRIYCSSVCPMGTLMDGIGAASRLVRRRRANFRFCVPSERTRFIFLATAIALILAGGSLLPTLLDPYSAYSRMVEEFIARPLGVAYAPMAYTLSSMAVAVVTALLVVAFAWKRGRIICNTVCPIGTVLGIGSRRAVFHMEIDPDRCINCGECERVCKAQCIKLPEKTIDRSRCVVCFNCTAACPSGAMNYKSGRYRLDMPMMQPTVGAGMTQNIEKQASE